MAQELYKLPKGWEWKTVGEVITQIQTGTTPPSAEEKYYSSEDVDWFAPSDFSDRLILNNSKRKLSRIAVLDGKVREYSANTVLLVAIGATIGKIGVIDNPATSNQQVTGILFNDKVFPKFAAIWMHYIKPIIIKSASQATLPIINQKGIKDLPFCLPPLPEQKRIVAKLDVLLSRIAQATQELQESLALADQLFASALDEAFNPLGSAKNAEGLYELPKGWRQVELGSVATLLNGRAYKQEELLDEGPTPVLRVGNFFSNRSWYYSDLELPEDKYCDNGDLLFAWSASFGPKIWDGPRVIFHYHIWKILTSAHIEKMFLFYLLDKDSEDIKSKGNGVGMFHATKGGMEKKIIPLPPLPEQKRIVQRLEALQAKQKQLKETLNEKIQGLNALKASLLDAAFRGEL